MQEVFRGYYVGDCEEEQAVGCNGKLELRWLWRVRVKKDAGGSSRRADSREPRQVGCSLNCWWAKEIPRRKSFSTVLPLKHYLVTKFGAGPGMQEGVYSLLASLASLASKEHNSGASESQTPGSSEGRWDASFPLPYILIHPPPLTCRSRWLCDSFS